MIHQERHLCESFPSFCPTNAIKKYSINTVNTIKVMNFSQCNNFSKQIFTVFIKKTNYEVKLLRYDPYTK